MYSRKLIFEGLLIVLLLGQTAQATTLRIFDIEVELPKSCDIPSSHIIYDNSATLYCHPNGPLSSFLVGIQPSSECEIYGSPKDLERETKYYSYALDTSQSSVNSHWVIYTVNQPDTGGNKQMWFSAIWDDTACITGVTENVDILKEYFRVIWEQVHNKTLQRTRR